MTNLDFQAIPYVPREFIDRVLVSAEQSFARHKLTADEVVKRYEMHLDRCAHLLRRYQFDQLADAIADFDVELRQVCIDRDAKLRGTDQFAPLRATGWTTHEIEFVEKSRAGRANREGRSANRLNDSRTRLRSSRSADAV